MRLCREQYYFWRIDAGTSNAFLVPMLDRPTFRLGVNADARQLTENEIRQFYEAYQASEARARVYHRAAMRHLIQRDFLFFALVVAVFLGIVLYNAASS
jgi:hypothetical protein